MLSRSGHAMFALRGGNLKEWDATYARPPASRTMLPPNRIPVDVDFDLVLCQSRVAHFTFLNTIAMRRRIPLLCLEHVLPHPTWSQALKDDILDVRGDLNVFISAYSRDAWGYGEADSVVIEHGVDTDLFRPLEEGHRANVCLSVVNDWINRDVECGYTFWRKATEGLPVRVLGKTPGLSEAAATVDDLAHAYRTSSVFLNTAQSSPIPTVVLEAMASGCCVISTRNPMLESIIEDGVNGFLVDGPEQMKWHAQLMLDQPWSAIVKGENARQTILERFGVDRFVADWDRTLRQAADVILKG